MGMIGAGKRDRRVRFERTTTVQEGLGGDAPGVWALLEHAFAAVRFGTSAERRQAGMEGASQVATFRVLSTANLRSATEADRIRFAPMGGNCDAADAPVWNITGGIAIGRGEIEFTAVTRKA